MSDAPANRVLVKMLDRLFAAMANGPSLNCRPHSSRQRIDLMQLARLKDIDPSAVLLSLLGPDAQCKITGRAKPIARRVGDNPFKPVEPAGEETAEQKQQRQDWSEQASVISKLHILADEARTYENDTGAYVLNLGFPLLSLPPGAGAGVGGQRSGTRRILAPIAYVPMALTVTGGTSPAVALACKEDEIDRVVPNTALLAWLERQTGKQIGDLFQDEEGAAPWREIAHLVRHVTQTLSIPTPPEFGGDDLPAQFALAAVPRSEELAGDAAVLFSAVLGLFPLANEGLLRDTQAMIAGESLDGPVESFIRAGVSLDQPPPPEVGPVEPEQGSKRPRVFAQERLVAAADPCQSRAVALARQCRGLVMHGPPGTGKSQTITNIIGDHLARGQRVLFVCDKRTALDVVANRLEHLGIGSLCALVHDPHRDQRELYKSIREQLENLPEATSDAAAERDVDKLDAQLQKLHDELTERWAALMAAQEDGQSFHDLMGQWLTIDAEPLELDASAASQLSLDAIESHATEIQTLLEHAQRVDYMANPWRKAAGIALRDLLSRPMDAVRAGLNAAASAAHEADAAAHEGMPPFELQPTPAEQAAARVQLAADVREAMAAESSLRVRWAKANLEKQRASLRLLQDAQGQLALLAAGPMDPELTMIVRDQPLTVAAVAQQVGTLEAYLAVSQKWYAFLAFGKKSAAAKVLQQFGLTADVPAAQRLSEFLKRLRARMVLSSIYHQLAETEQTARWEPDDSLRRVLGEHQAVLGVLVKVRETPALRSAGKATVQALTKVKPDAAEALIAGLEASPARADAIAALQEAMSETGLFSQAFLDTAHLHLLAGKAIADVIAALRDRARDLESVLRIIESQAKLPPALAAAIEKVASRSLGVEASLQTLRKAALSSQISSRIRQTPLLQDVDAQRIQTSLDRYRELDLRKKSRVRDAIMHRWVSRQRERLLVGTGSRLNSAGADMRRRLTMRGENALRLRQVVSIGQTIEGGDPLYDLRPVWMASPETVAQIFPRQPLFDVVIFDEASQCRLEEALPVITRAQRVVIAGDPKQLPPTRFFESAVAASEQEEIESDQQLFEIQQAEVEDLLSAALSLEVQSCYLDVHYRSANADLIEFSNQQFYHSRLQPIPGHPANRTRYAPLTLYHAGGVYDDRTNVIEADHVCRIVRDLLRRADSPSIGIACFNLAQRDLIVEKLDDMAAEDAEFGRRLAEARTRRGEGSFEGLFVKNLENVQGDERDHIIISTTYGPDSKGRFYRRFGPLGRTGGGRRLNVLVTRARQEVHLVTSIPPDVYRALPPIPPGQTAGGGWLLFAYLHYAEVLAEAYERRHEQVEQARAAERAQVEQWSTAYPSQFARALGQRLAATHNLGSDVHWGNDGFSIDLALHHPVRAEDRTLGVICDATRFAKADDPIEWEAFRTMVLQSQGWQLHRLWTPQFFRDPAGCMANIRQQAEQLVAGEKDPDSIAVKED